ncbi:MAG: hypothetical protein AAB386_03490, partial [Patescibacteria group bacterium]
MGHGGGKYSRKKYINALHVLERQHPDKFTLANATKETYKIHWASGDPRRPYPVAANGNKINPYIAEQLGKLFEKHGV